MGIERGGKVLTIPQNPQFPAGLITGECENDVNKTIQLSPSDIERDYPLFLQNLGLIDELRPEESWPFDTAERGITRVRLFHEIDAVNNILLMGKTGEQVPMIFPTSHRKDLANYARATHGVRLPNIYKTGAKERLYYTFEGRGRKYLNLVNESSKGEQIPLSGFSLPNPLERKGFVVSEEMMTFNERLAREWARMVTSPIRSGIFRDDTFTYRDVMAIMNIKHLGIQLRARLDSITISPTNPAADIEVSDLRMGSGLLYSHAEEEGRVRAAQVTLFIAEKLVEEFFVKQRKHFRPGRGAVVNVTERDFNMYASTPVSFNMRYFDGWEFSSMGYDFSSGEGRLEFFDWLYVLGKRGTMFTNGHKNQTAFGA